MATLAELITQKRMELEDLRGKIQMLEASAKSGDREAAQALRSQAQVRENQLAGLLTQQARRDV